jgi:hypothetical protein
LSHLGGAINVLFRSLWRFTRPSSQVCNSVEEMETFATSWKRSKHNDEKRMSEFLLNEEIPRLQGIARAPPVAAV